MIPFLKNRDDASAYSQGEEDATLRRQPDQDGDEDYGLVDAIAEDMMEAFHKKDKSLLKESIRALCDYIENKDEIQDQEQMEE